MASGTSTGGRWRHNVPTSAKIVVNRCLRYSKFLSSSAWREATSKSIIQALSWIKNIRLEIPGNLPCTSLLGGSEIACGDQISETFISISDDFENETRENCGDFCEFVPNCSPH